MYSDFIDKVILITGASSGIGEATAISLAKQGAAIIITGSNASKLEQVSQQLDTLNATYHVVCINLLEEDAGRILVEKSIVWKGRLDAIVSSAGGGRFTRFKKMTELEFNQSIRLNLLAPVEILRTALPYLTQSPQSNVIIVNTIAAREPAMPRASAYLAGKSGLIHFAESLFSEIRDEGVKVTSILPDMTDTTLIPDILGIDRNTMILPSTVANTICFALQTPKDACITEIHIRPQPSLKMLK